MSVALTQQKPYVERKLWYHKPKTKTYNFREFMQAESVKKIPKKPLWSVLPLAVAPIWSSTKAFAQETVKVMAEPSMQAKIMTAFEPILELVQSLAYPVALMVVLGGGLFVMVGNTEKGFSLIQRAGLGYILVMMLPMLLDVLVDAMNSVV